MDVLIATTLLVCFYVNNSKAAKILIVGNKFVFALLPPPK